MVERNLSARIACVSLETVIGQTHLFNPNLLSPLPPTSERLLKGQRMTGELLHTLYLQAQQLRNGGMAVKWILATREYQVLQLTLSLFLQDLNLSPLLSTTLKVFSLDFRLQSEAGVAFPHPVPRECSPFSSGGI